MTKVYLLVIVGMKIKILSRFMLLALACGTQTMNTATLLLENKSIEVGEKLNLKIDIENTGAVDGKEVVQVYVRDLESSVERLLKNWI